MHQLGVRVKRSTDPKQQSYIQNKIKNAIHKYDTQKYGLKSTEKYASNQRMAITEPGEKEPTNAFEDLKQIKNFRKLQYEKVKEDVFRKIDDSHLSNKEKINRSLSQLLETRSMHN